MRDKIDDTLIELAMVNSFYCDNFDKISINCYLLMKYLRRLKSTKRIYKECLSVLISKDEADTFKKVYYYVLIKSNLIEIKNGKLVVR